MLRAATTWYRWDPERCDWKYNHFQFGKCNDSRPKPMFAGQECWKSYEWAKKFGYYQSALGETEVVEESKLITDE